MGIWVKQVGGKNLSFFSLLSNTLMDEEAEELMKVIHWVLSLYLESQSQKAFRATITPSLDRWRHQEQGRISAIPKVTHSANKGKGMCPISQIRTFPSTHHYSWRVCVSPEEQTEEILRSSSFKNQEIRFLKI